MAATLWTVTLRGLVMGEGTDYPITQPGITGLGIPSARTADTQRGMWSGDVGGDDVLEKRVLTIPVAVFGDTFPDFWTNFLAFKAAWVSSAVDIPIVINFGGEASLTYNGRPRMAEAAPDFMGSNTATCLCIFECLNPFAVGEPVDTAF
jgi:hypothetical protein